MIIGFGDTEKRFEDSIQEKITAHVVEEFGEEPDDCFSEAFIEKMRDWVGNLAKQSQEDGKAYKTAADHPDRYSYFWAYTLGDVNHMAFILSIHHINRRHAFSPDGWACLQSKLVFDVEAWEAGRAKRDRAAA